MRFNELFANEIFLYIIAGAFLFFSYTNFKPEVATGIFILIVLSFMILVADPNKKLSIPFSRTNTNWLQAIGWSVGLGFAFVMVSSLFMALPFQSTLKLLSVAPAFATAGFLVAMTWWVTIPFAESQGAVRFYEYLNDRFKSNLFDLRNPIVWIIIGIICVSLVLLHSTAYGVTNNKALFLSFLFFVMGLIMSIKFKEAKQFVLTHVFINGLASFSTT